MKSVVWAKCLILFLITVSSAFSISSELIEKNIQVETKETNANLAKKELIEKAIEQSSEDLIKEIIGLAKYNRNKSVINSKILKSSERFVPYVKPGQLSPVKDPQNKDQIIGYTLGVNLKVSQTDLQKSLLEYGLLYESDSTPIIFPMIKWIDKVDGKSWSWWEKFDESNIYLANFSKNLEVNLLVNFDKKGFYLIRPQNNHYEAFLKNNYDNYFSDYTKSLGSGWISRFFGNEEEADVSKLFNLFNAQVIINGDITIEKNPKLSDSFMINFNLSAIQNQNLREIAEVKRRFETEKGSFQIVVEKKLKEVMDTVCLDLTNQVFETWQKGSIGANLYRLSVITKTSPLIQEKIKALIKSQIFEIKNIKERLISSSETEFEIESNAPTKVLSQKYQKIVGPEFVLILNDENDKRLTYRLTREGGTK